MKNAGNVPLKSAREIDRSAIAHMYGWDLEDVYKCAQSFKALYRRQPESTITFREYLDLMRDSGLTPAMVGKRKGQFHLARYNDEGAYELGNCRFVDQLVNQLERKAFRFTAEYRQRASLAARRRPQVLCACGGSFSPGMYGRWHGANCRDTRATLSQNQAA